MQTEGEVPLIHQDFNHRQKNLNDAFKIILVAFPRSLENLLYIWTPYFLLTFFAGHISVEALAIVNLSFCIYKITIRNISGGLGMTGASIFGQVYGNGNYKALGILLQRLFLLGFILICIALLIYIPIEYILQALGQDEAFASSVANFLYYLIPFCLFDATFWIFSVYFQAQKIVFLQIGISFFGVFVGILSFWLFTKKYLWDIKGLSLGYGSIYFFNGICIIFALISWHVKMKGNEKDPWSYGFSKLAFKELKSLFTVILNALFSFALLSSFIDYLTLTTSLLQNSTLYLGILGILIAMMNFGASVFYPIAVYFGVLIATEVGNGYKEGVKFVIKIMIFVYLIILSSLFALLLYFQYDIGSWWSSDQQVQDEVAYFIPYICIFLLGHVQICACIAILLGTKRQSTLLILSSIGMFTLCFPLSLVSCFVLNFGFRGLIIGFIFSYFIQSVCFISFCATINWDKEIEIALEKLVLLERTLTISNDV